MSPEAQELIRRSREAAALLSPDMSAQELRAHLNQRELALTGVPDHIDIERADVGGVAGEWVRSRHIPPELKRTIIYLHGGYVYGSAAARRPLTWRLAEAGRCAVLALDFRLAPEHPFPAALDDCVSVYDALLAHGVSSTDIAIVGDSAGGGMAFGLLLRLQDECKLLPRAVIGVSPFVDATFASDSLTRNRHDDPVGEKAFSWIKTALAAYLGDAPAEHRYISPLLQDLHGFPPACIVSSAHEVLADDSTRLAQRLRESDVEVALHMAAFMPHIFPLYADQLPEARNAIQTMGRFLLRQWVTVRR